MNPIRLNYGHLEALQSLFSLPDDNFIPLVVFTGDAEFKTDLGPRVLKLHQLIPFLTAPRPAIFDERKMAYIVGRIEMKLPPFPRNRRIPPKLHPPQTRQLLKSESRRLSFLRLGMRTSNTAHQSAHEQ